MSSADIVGGGKRSHFTEELVILNGAALSDVLDFRSVASAAIFVPASFLGEVAFKVSITEDGTFTALYDEDDALIEIATTAERWYFIPVKVFPCHFVKIWSQTAGVDTNQNADRTLVIMAKA